MPGPAKRPALAVVREGNPGHRPVPESITVPPATFGEPDWAVEFPTVRVPARPKRPVRRPGVEDKEWDAALIRHAREVHRWQAVKVDAEGAVHCRGRAREEWARTVPVLQASVGLGNVDFAVVVDFCVCVARLQWCERRITLDGLIVEGQRGPCRNPLTTVATQYRTQLKTYIRELGLSPSARTGVPSRKDDDDDDVFD